MIKRTDYLYFHGDGDGDSMSSCSEDSPGLDEGYSGEDYSESDEYDKDGINEDEAPSNGDKSVIKGKNCGEIKSQWAEIVEEDEQERMEKKYKRIIQKKTYENDEKDYDNDDDDDDDEEESDEEKGAELGGEQEMEKKIDVKKMQDKMEEEGKEKPQQNNFEWDVDSLVVVIPGSKKNVLKCKVCPEIICFDEEFMQSHLNSKNHFHSLRKFKEGKSRYYINNLGLKQEIEETHSERYLRFLNLENDAKIKPKKIKKKASRRKKMSILKKLRSNCPTINCDSKSITKEEDKPESSRQRSKNIKSLVKKNNRAASNSGQLKKSDSYQSPLEAQGVLGGKKKLRSESNDSMAEKKPKKIKIVKDEQNAPSSCGFTPLTNLESKRSKKFNTEEERGNLDSDSGVRDTKIKSMKVKSDNELGEFNRQESKNFKLGKVWASSKNLGPASNCTMLNEVKPQKKQSSELLKRNKKERIARKGK